jgi:hypothetical protein
MIIFIWLGIRFSLRIVGFGLLSFVIAFSWRIRAGCGLSLILSLLCPMIFRFIRCSECGWLIGSFTAFLSLSSDFTSGSSTKFVASRMMICVTFIHLLFEVLAYLS